MNLHSQFVRDPSFAFLNAGTLSRTPIKVLEFMAARRLEEEKNPTRSLYGSVGVFWRAQEAMATYLGADPDDLFFRSNITAALNDFLFALPLEGGGEILATGLEYGAVANLAKRRAAQAGMEFRQAPIPLHAGSTEQEIANSILHSIRPETRVLVMSHVATGTGLILPIERVGREAQSKGIVVVVDGAHAPGSMPLRIADLPVDFYGGNLHKWFMGPTGTAFGWVHPSWKGHLEWKFGGWASFSKPAHFHTFHGGFDAAERLFPGTMDSVPFAALEELLCLRAEWGEENIRIQQRGFRDFAANAAEGFGWERVSPRAPGLLGPLVSFRAPAAWMGIDPVALATRIFKEAKVQLALPMVQGEMLVRFSPPAYATEEEVALGMERLKSFAP